MSPQDRQPATGGKNFVGSAKASSAQASKSASRLELQAMAEKKNQQYKGSKRKKRPDLETIEPFNLEILVIFFPPLPWDPAMGSL